jgi:alcohol dehydrogenase class IV
MRFEFATAGRIWFGPGSVQELGPVIRAWGTRALVVTGRSPARAAVLDSVLASAGIEHARFAVAGEPTTDAVRQGAKQACDESCDVVIGLGGGSAIDAAKAIAALATNPGDLAAYLEVVGDGKPITRPPLPCVAIPTTAGTGAEVTRNAVLASVVHRVKISMRSPLMLPRLAVVDPELTVGLPPAITAATGLDALTQLIEPYVSVKANPMTDGFCIEGLRRVARSLRRAYEQGDDLAAREDMALASLFSGLALANAGLGAVHGFAGPIGGMFPATPHGAVCAGLLPHVMEVNVRALQQRVPNHAVLARYDEIGRILTGNPQAEAIDGICWIRDLCRDTGIPPLHGYGMDQKDLPVLIEKAARASSMKGNPVLLTPIELTEILEKAL